MKDIFGFKTGQWDPSELWNAYQYKTKQYRIYSSIANDREFRAVITLYTLNHTVQTR